MLKPGLTIALVLSLMQLCSSCRPGQTTPNRQIKEIHSLSDTRPDSALTAIRQIERGSLSSRRNKACFALAYSKILDKNAIDIRSDSIISPALEYYERRGSRNEKAETYYYAGRVWENTGDYEKAAEMLIKAEQNLHNSGNKHSALVYASKARIYHKSLIFDKAAENYKKAADYNLKDGNIDRYASNRLKEADCLLSSGNPDGAKEIVDEVWKLRDNISARTHNKLYQVKVNAAERRSAEEALEEVAIYEKMFRNLSYMDWLLAARVYLKAGKVKAAGNALEAHLRKHTPDASYHYYKARVSELEGNYAEATNAYKEYIRLQSSKGSDLLSQETRFIEEREIIQELYEKEKSRRIILSLAITAAVLALMLAGVTISAIRKQLRLRNMEKEDLQRKIDELLEEREELAMLEISNREGRKIIYDRLRIIDQFVMSDAFNDRIFEQKASDTLKQIISDRDEFVRQNRLIFNQSSSRFISHLKECGLDDREIDHCCLYAIGMNGKMVTTFTNIKRHYHIGSDVRKKLGLSGRDTNISIYIRNLHKTLESGQTES